MGSLHRPSRLVHVGNRLSLLESCSFLNDVDGIFVGEGKLSCEVNVLFELIYYYQALESYDDHGAFK